MNIFRKFWNWLNPPAPKVPCVKREPQYRPDEYPISTPPRDWSKRKNVNQAYRDDAAYMSPYMGATEDVAYGYNEPEPDTQFGGGRFGGGGASSSWEDDSSSKSSSYQSDDSYSSSSDNSSSYDSGSSDSGSSDSGGSDD